MTTFLVRRFFQMGLVLIISTIVVYIIISFVPGGPLEDLMQTTDRRRRPTAQDIARIEKALGLDKPLALRYITWVAGDDWLGAVGFPQYVGEKKGIIRGDWGTSWFVYRNQPVLKVMGQRLAATLTLQITALVVALAFAIPIGIYSAVRQYSKLDYFFTTFSFIGISLPSFWFALMMIAAALALRRSGLFAFPTGDIAALRDYTLPLVGRIDAGSFADRALHLVMPVTVLALLSMAGFSRFLRASMLEVLRQDYVRTARAKGLRERIVILKHAMRNALIPLITILVYSIPAIFNGSLILESNI